jgi:PAS domain S-box-containing protein
MVPGAGAPPPAMSTPPYDTQLDLFFRDAPDAICIYGREGEFLYTNAAAERSLGCSREALAGRRWAEVGPALPAMAAVEAQRLSVLETGEPATHEAGGDLTGRWFEYSLHPVRGAGGGVEAVAVVAREVTARKRVEFELRLLARVGEAVVRSLELGATLEGVARIVVEAFADSCAIDLFEPEGAAPGVCIADREPAREAYVRELRAAYPPAPPKLPRRDDLRPEQTLLLPEMGDEVLRPGAVDERHLAILRGLDLGSGLVAPLVAGGRSLGTLALGRRRPRAPFGPDDALLAEQVARRVALAVDNASLHERLRRAEAELSRQQEALRLSEARFRTAANAAPVMLWTADDQNRGTWYNDAWLAFRGRPLEQELGFGWAEGVHPDDLERSVAHCQACFAARRPFTMEFRLRRADGAYRWVLDTGAPLFGPGGEFTGYIGSCLDIDDRKAAEDARARLLALEQEARTRAEADRARFEALAAREEEARRRAEEAGRAKDEFLSTLSHELRTPLNAILGWASLAAAGGLDEAQRARAFETIERNARVQVRLIEDMLDLSRIAQGKFVLAVGPVELVRVVEAALDAVRPAADAKGVRVQPVLDSHATIVGDADRLQQIVWNLASNAIKFTPKGGRVQVRLRRDRSYVEVTVADSGQGIAPDFLPHVFEPFRQADGGITRRHGGLGLGLSIVRSLVELHGGTVSAHSDGPDQGATFVVRLPLAPLRADRASPVPEGAEGAPRASFACPPELKGLRVLVVDDEPDTRALLAFVLGQCEAAVTAASGAAEALALLEGGEFDVIVSDVGMPDEDGYAFLRQVRALPDERARRLPALALTAYARSEDRTQALRAGFDMHLAKPIEPQELLVVVAHLGARRAR